jgi:chemotaxis protein MotB
MRTGSVAGAVVLAGVLAGCGVKKEVHQKTLDELTATQSELEATRRQRDECKHESGELSGRLGESEKTKGQLAKEKEATAAELAELRKQREASEKRLEAFRQLRDRFKQLVDTGKLQVAFRNGQMVLKLPSGILFPSGQAELTPQGQAALGEVTKILMEFKDRRFVIAGHTDTDRIKSKKFKDNWDLSNARALSVVKFMIGAGFPPKNVGAAGYGEFDPVAPNDTEQNKQQNRRIEIILVPDLSELPNLTGAEP